MSIIRHATAFLTVAALLAVGSLATAAPKAEPGIAISDDFVGPGLNRSVWTARQIPRSRFRFDGHTARSADGRSLEITTRGDDNACIGEPEPCQRNEIRVRRDLQIRFGTEAWYGFSFRVESYVDPEDSNRLVIGQWKEQSDGSPFVAQRFDNRIFRITVQDSECRAIIAEAPSGPGRLGELLILSPSHRMICTRAPEIRLTPRNPAYHILPDPYEAWVDMVYRIRGGRDGDGLVEVWANGSCVVRAEGTIGNRDFAGPNQYFKFGVYRDNVDYTTRIHIDSFRRAASHGEIDPDFTPCAWWDR